MKSTWVPISNMYKHEKHYSRRDGEYPSSQYQSSHQKSHKFNDPCQEHHLHKWKNDPVCDVPICINAFHVGENGIANSFDNVMSAMAWFAKLRQNEAGEKLLRKTLVIAVGLGKCDQLYKGIFKNFLYQYNVESLFCYYSLLL